MYVADSYRAANPEAAVEIIAANLWAVLVGCTDEPPLASHIPVISTENASHTRRCPDISRELIHIRGSERKRPIFETEARDYGHELGTEKA
jgi:predicted FMN-binding regulatory protein PaiB